MPLLAYGTLLYRESMATTVGRDASAAKTFRPVTVHGYRRLFNLRPTHYEPSFRLSDRAIEAGASNIEPAADATFNAIAFEVSADELAQLDVRERYYARVRVPMRHFASDEPAGEAFVYASQPDAAWIVRDPDALLPRWTDVVWARTGAYRISEAFGQAFDASTYLADGHTLLVDRYRDVLDVLMREGVPGI